MSEIAIPNYLKAIKCFDIDRHFGRTSYRFSWGEFATGWRFGFSYSVYHDEGTISFSPFWGTLYLKAPMIINQRSGTEDWNASYGLSFHDKGFWWHWRTKFWVWRPLGDWRHIRHDVQRPDGSFVPFVGSWEKDKSPDGRHEEVHDYTYVLRNGTVQKRKSTICVEEREWRWKLLFTLPYPRKVRRCIDVQFDDEVGEGTGSWKGGAVGCGYTLLPNETPLQCLRRMEMERKFT